jgi:hypothetical protein
LFFAGLHKSIHCRHIREVFQMVRVVFIAYNTLRTIYRDPYRQVTTSTLERLAMALGTDHVF